MTIEKIVVNDDNLDPLLEEYAGIWMRACMFPKIFSTASTSRVTKWYGDGRIRRRPIEPDGHEYLVGDFICARYSQPYPRRILTRTVDGAMELRCNSCEVWRPMSDYNADKSAQYGIKTTCRNCLIARAGGLAPGDKRHSRSMRPYRDMVDAKRVMDVIDRIFKLEISDSEICVRAGVDRDVVRNMRRRSTNGGSLDIYNVDRLFTGLDLAHEFIEISRDVSYTESRWHPDYDCCAGCERDDVPHLKDGVCSFCYQVNLLGSVAMVGSGHGNDGSTERAPA